jgi:pyruvate,orthophosphate dikinase
MELAQQGQRSVLIRIETSPEDIHGMNAAEGILTSRGGMTSHAALVARGMGKPCIVGCTALKYNSVLSCLSLLSSSSIITKKFLKESCEPNPS